jgi:hypothetical protein
MKKLKLKCKICGKEYKKSHSQNVLYDRKFIPKCDECLEKKKPKRV